MTVIEPPIRSGEVVWTGDNPFIYLKREGDERWANLALYFRVTASDHGTGHMVLVVQDPSGDGEPSTAPVCLSDNEALARSLLSEFVIAFALFRPVAGIETCAISSPARFESESDGQGGVVERAVSGDQEVVLTWGDLETPFLADLAPGQSSTGRHEMVSVFRPAHSASISVGGVRLDGQPVMRDFLGRRCPSAALALSETWILPAGG